MTAQKLDGVATATAIKAELTERVAALAARGIVPGLGTLLVGDDPGSRSYVTGKHRDCAEVGVASIQVELPASATFDEIADAVRALNDDPAVTGFIVQLPLPKGIDENAILELVDPGEGCRRPAPHEPRSARARRRPGDRRRGAAAVHAGRHHRAAHAARRRDRGQARHGDRPRHHGRPPARAAADPQGHRRHRHADALPHGRPRRRGAPGRHRGRGGRPAAPRAGRLDQAGRRRARCRCDARGDHRVRPGEARRATSIPPSPRSPAGSRRTPAEWAR